MIAYNAYWAWPRAVNTVGEKVCYKAFTGSDVDSGWHYRDNNDIAKAQ